MPCTATPSRSACCPAASPGLTNGKDADDYLPAHRQPQAGSRPVPLKATSDAGLPVDYYVVRRPGRDRRRQADDRRVPGARDVADPGQVVACQFGRGVEPLVQTALPVEQTIQIEKP